MSKPVTHYYVSDNGRFAITACSDPEPFRRLADTTNDWEQVTCKRCLKKVGKAGYTGGTFDALAPDTRDLLIRWIEQRDNMNTNYVDSAVAADQLDQCIADLTDLLDHHKVRH